MKSIAIIPAYNEASRIEAAIKDAARFVDDVVVVDDCSADDTSGAALNAGAHVLRHTLNRGQGAALATGTEFALEELGADAVVHFDADGQMQGRDIPTLLKPIKTGEADIVLGSRFLGKESNMPTARRVTLRAARLFTVLVSGIRVTDTHCGFRALSARAAAEAAISIDRMAHSSEILDMIKVKKLRYAERPVTITYSRATLKKGMSFTDGFAVLKDFFKNKFFDEL